MSLASCHFTELKNISFNNFSFSLEFSTLDLHINCKNDTFIFF